MAIASAESFRREPADSRDAINRFFQGAGLGFSPE